MASLARYFGRPPFELAVYFLGSSNGEGRSPPSHLHYRLIQFSPRGTWLSLLRGVFPKRRRAPETTCESDPKPKSLTLDDYRWPAAIQQFRRAVSQFNPDSIIFEYVTTAYLAESVRGDRLTRKPILILDSHDLLHRRCEQFCAAGHTHWLAIDSRQEMIAAASFDVILAIQDDEAAWFEDNVPMAKVMVVGHSFDFDDVKVTLREPSSDVVIGYFGSNNSSNTDAIMAFVEQAWPAVVGAHPTATLLIGGTVIDLPAIAVLNAQQRIRCIRDFRTVAEFYDQIDIAINPVRFGTGLKIKNVEALAYGRPVVTTEAGRIGIPLSFAESCCGAPSVAAMAETISRWMADPPLRWARSRQAAETAKRELSDLAVLRELTEFLLSQPFDKSG